ncbi:MAG: GNAT family N-acetyltransferase [Rhabdochlamydiaceae bacterium]|nr:GNAT family N-acetyltransferase [Rhabdochlamydiaceae bacterium]
MSEPLGFDIRYTHVSDAPYVLQWLKEPGIQQWFPVSLDKEIEDAVQCWVGFCKYNSSLTATIDGVPVGIGTLFLMPYRKVAHHCLFKLLVDPAHQRKGVGRALLKNLKHLAKNGFRLELMHIEIFEGNPIESLLLQFNFHEYGRQEHFVKDKDRYLGRILYESYL